MINKASFKEWGRFVRGKGQSCPAVAMRIFVSLFRCGSNCSAICVEMIDCWLEKNVYFCKIFESLSKNTDYA